LPAGHGGQRNRQFWQHDAGRLVAVGIDGRNQEGQGRVRCWYVGPEPAWDVRRLLDARNRWEAERPLLDQGPIVEPRVPAGGRLDASTDPRIERREKSALRPAIVVGVSGVLAEPALGRERPAAVLRAGDGIDPDVGRIRQVRLPVEGDVSQGGDATTIPVLRRRVDEEELGREARGNAGAEAIADAGDRVDRRAVEDGELRLRERAEFVRLRETLVEAAASGGARVDERRIERCTALLIDSEPS
jgi:hypothetical protein